MHRLRAPLLALLLAVAACTPAPFRGSTADSGAAAFDQAVEVVSEAPYPVVVKYYGRGGGPVWLGEVSARGRATFVLPGNASVIFAETEDGRLVASDRRRTSRLVRFRRIPAD
jgi:hypothetical protein